MRIGGNMGYGLMDTVELPERHSEYKHYRVEVSRRFGGSKYPTLYCSIGGLQFLSVMLQRL